MKKVLIHGSGQKADSWNKMLSYIENKEDFLFPSLADLLAEKPAAYPNIYHAFSNYCSFLPSPFHLCNLSHGGILALNYTIEHPDKVKSLVIIATPHQIPTFQFYFQKLIFSLLPPSFFQQMAFNKRQTLTLGKSLKDFNFRTKLHLIACPTLLLCGEKDKTSMHSLCYFQEHIKQTEYKFFPGIGHIVNEEDPQQLADVLQQFYQSLA